MKLLFDQNLSHRLIRDIQGTFPDSQHVIHLNLMAEDDEILWKFAADNDFVIISKDSDFFHRALTATLPKSYTSGLEIVQHSTSEIYSWVKRP